MEAGKVILLGMTEAKESGRTVEKGAAYTMAADIRSKTDRPCLRQPLFNWAVKDKFTEIKHFKLEALNIFSTKHYSIS